MLKTILLQPTCKCKILRKRKTKTLVPFLKAKYIAMKLKIEKTVYLFLIFFAKKLRRNIFFNNSKLYVKLLIRRNNKLN